MGVRGGLMEVYSDCGVGSGASEGYNGSRGGGGSSE